VTALSKEGREQTSRSSLRFSASVVKERGTELGNRKEAPCRLVRGTKREVLSFTVERGRHSPHGNLGGGLWVRSHS